MARSRSFRAALAILACGGTLFALASQAGESMPWGYSGDQGPDRWGELSPDFATCSQGQNQSPIDIVDAVDAELPPLELQYSWYLGHILNTGHALQLSDLPGSFLSAKGARFELAQFHFHSPSENRIQGRLYPLEAHFVHRDARGKLAVLAVLFEEGAANPSLDRILAIAPAQVDRGPAQDLALRESDLLPEERSYYLYSGSLTTPPCTEGVRWFVMQHPRSASAKQIADFQRLAGPNAREPQPLHSRLVLR